MKKSLKRGFSLVICLAVLLALLVPAMHAGAAANPNPSWNVDERVVFHGQCLPYDYYAAKDPTIVYYGGKYLVYYTGANQSGGWQMCFTSASTIAGLKTAPRTYMSKIGESYFCAPELFYFEPKGLWYLVYQDGTYGAAYSTSTNPADPNSWSGPKSFGISGNMGWDYYIICDGSTAYMYNTPSDGSGKLYLRKTSLSNFPTGWSAPTVACSNVFEAAAAYKSLADGQYYLLVEAMIDGRSYELFTSSSAGGPWTLVNSKWATRANLTKYNADPWTTNVSHGELIRAGYNQKLEINDINRVDFLIQGTTNLSGDYQKITWDLGLIHNYTGSTTTPPPSGSYKRLRNAATGLYIDGMGSTANGSNACQWASSTSNNQQWTIETSGGYVMFKNRATGLYLDGMGRNTNGSICGQWAYSNSSNQQWTQETVGSNVKFKNRATGLYLDGMGSTGNGSNLCQYAGGSSTNQQWQIQ